MEEYIRYGLVYSAYNLGLIDSKEILKHLQTTPVTTQTLLAYQHLLLHDIDQNIEGEHFIINAPMEYGALYMTKYEEEGDLGPYLYKGILKMSTDFKFRNKIMILGGELVGINKEDIPLAIQARNKHVLQFKIKNEDFEAIFNALVATDWFEEKDLLKAFYNHQFFENLLEMCSDKKELPDYWEKISSHYKSLVEYIFENSLLIPNVKYPKLIADLFPDFFSFPIDKLTEKEWFIYQSPSHMQGYLLGYPIYMMNPTREELLKDLFYISEKGIDDFSSQLREKHKSYWESFSKKLFNEEDTLHEDIFSYPLFDVVGICYRDGIWLITRPEFKNILELDRNPYTNSPLGWVEKLPIIMRDVIAETYMIPNPLPVKDAYNQLNIS